MTKVQLILIFILIVANGFIIYWDYRISKMNEHLMMLVHGLATGKIKVKELEVEE